MNIINYDNTVVRGGVLAAGKYKRKEYCKYAI